jgi:hypothetical protein
MGMRAPDVVVEMSTLSGVERSASSQATTSPGERAKAPS